MSHTTNPTSAAVIAELEHLAKAIDDRAERDRRVARDLDEQGLQSAAARAEHSSQALAQVLHELRAATDEIRNLLDDARDPLTPEPNEQLAPDANEIRQAERPTPSAPSNSRPIDGGDLDATWTVHCFICSTALDTETSDLDDATNQASRWGWHLHGALTLCPTCCKPSTCKDAGGAL